MTLAASFLSMVSLPLPLLTGAAIIGVLVDRWLGEPKRAHPLVGFGKWAMWLEHRLNHRARWLGVLAWALGVLPFVGLTLLLLAVLPLWLQLVLHVALLWFALGSQSLESHIAPIGAALAMGDIEQARHLAARVVSRDLSDADETAIAKAAVESALENGNDAVFGALFWFLIGGGPAALAFRLINTLDAMWGYRTPRLLSFGWAAARIDDLANWIPARLTAASYLLLGKSQGSRTSVQAWRCWREQAPLWDSPNAGPVMASGAGSLGVLLGGVARYHGVEEQRPLLGCGAAPVAADVARALRLVRATLYLWLAVAVLLSLIMSVTMVAMQHHGIPLSLALLGDLPEGLADWIAERIPEWLRHGLAQGGAHGIA